MDTKTVETTTDAITSLDTSTTSIEDVEECTEEEIKKAEEFKV